MGAGFNTVGFILLGFVVLPTLILKPRLLNPWLIIYPLIVITMVPELAVKTISFGSVNVYIKDILLAYYCCCAGYVVLMRFIARKRILNVPDDARTLVVFVLLYIIMHVTYMFAALYQGVPLQSVIRRFSDYASCLYFFSPMLFLHEKHQVKTLSIFIVLIAFLYPVYQLYEFMNITNWDFAHTSSNTIRLGGGSNAASIIACALFAILIWRKRIIYDVISFSPIVSIFLLGSRSALVALGVSLTFIFAWTKKITKSVLFVYIGAFSLFLALITFGMVTGHDFLGETIKRAADTFNTENETTLARAYSIRDNFFVFKKKPITGIGYNYESLSKIFPPSSSLSGQVFPQYDYKTMGEINVLHPHNFVFHFLSHTGIMGTFLIFAIIGLSLKRCYSFISEGYNLRNYGIFLFCLITFFLIMALMNMTFTSEGYVFWILCGVSVLFSKNGVNDLPF